MHFGGLYGLEKQVVGVAVAVGDIDFDLFFEN